QDWQPRLGPAEKPDVRDVDQLVEQNDRGRTRDPDDHGKAEQNAVLVQLEAVEPVDEIVPDPFGVAHRSVRRLPRAIGQLPKPAAETIHRSPTAINSQRIGCSSLLFYCLLPTLHPAPWTLHLAPGTHFKAAHGGRSAARGPDSARQ